jgi:uncharacterized membrane protein
MLVTIAVVSAVIISSVIGFVFVKIIEPKPSLVVQPKLVVAPSILDFGKLEQGVKLTLPVSISNTSGQQLSWTVTEDTGSTTWLAIQTRSATIEAEGHQLDEVTVDTSHLSLGNISALLTINSYGVKAQVTVRVDVLRPGSPKLNIFPTSLNFSTDTTATTVPQQTILVINGGTMILKWQVNAGDARWLTLDKNSKTIRVLQPGGKQVINVAVMKGLSPGIYAATVTITSNDVDQRVPVSLVVISPVPSPGTPTSGITTSVPGSPRLAVTPASITFNNVVQGATATQQVAVRNSGGQALNWNLDRTSLPGWLSVDTNSGTVQHGNSQTINVTANASDLSPGSYSATLNFSSSGGKAPVPVTLTVSATPPAPAQIAVSSNSLDFGAMDPGTTKTLQENISNNGGQLLSWNVDNASLPSWLSVDTNSGTVQAGNSTTINVTANTSSLSPGPYSAALNFTSNGGNAQVQVTLTINALPVMGVSPNPLDFGTVTSGNTATLQEMVNNSGGQPLIWSLDTSSLPSWLTVDTSSGTIQAGNSTTINLIATTAALSPGPYSATLNFTSSNGGGSIQVPVTLTVQ